MRPSAAAWALGVLAVATLALVASCGRSPLFDGAPAPRPDAAVVLDATMEAGTDHAPDRGPDIAPDVGPDRAPDRAPDVATDKPPVCQPQPEVCNGVDDDCDGQVDEGQPAIPCPQGGSRYCIAGRLSDCPRRCDVCVPGGSRVCFVSFCTYWGVQDCAADGRSFGACKEASVPDACRAVADAKKKSRDLEQCCLEHGYCCLDEFDFDHDGDNTEMLGRCESLLCGD